MGKAHLPSERLGGERKLSSTALTAESFVEEALRWLPNTPDPTPEEDLTSASDWSNGSNVAAQGGRILLADDNADMRDYVRRLLSAHYQVEAVTNGREALQRALAAPPDVVLTDIMMPELDGIGLLRELRSDVRTRTLPVILLSARAGEEARSEGMNAGADDYLVKPFSSRELLARVGAHLRLGQARKHAFQALHESEERFRAYVLASSDVIYRMNTDWTEMRYLEGRDFIADTQGPNRSWLYKYIHPDDQPAVLDAIHRAIERKAPFEMEHRVIRIDGTLGWTFSRAIPLLDESGQILEWFGAARDITERKQAEEELQRFNEDLQRANRELEEFAYVASHDLQEPLRMVNIYTQLLLKEQLIASEKAEQYGAFIRNAVTRMEELIQDLLSYSRAIHKSGYQDGVADLGASVSQALSNVAAAVKETNATVTVDPLPRVHGDTAQYTHVFQNLLSNSLKYSRVDEPPKIHISVKQVEHETIITVLDNGIGFEQKYAEQIFGLFKRLYRDEYPGTGLGLAICQRIVERYGGRMWAEGKPGEGAAFSFSVPTLNKP
jgi:signal transduction histidine kinase/CheY-like chemotaxis protein